MASDQKYWTRIIIEARKHPDGIESYLAEHGVSRPAYYNWFKKLKSKHPQWKKSASRKGKKLGPRRKKMFVPINIEPAKATSTGAIEIRLSGGHTIAFPEGVDEASLVAIVQALGNGKC
jgi:hypothetical protein